MHTTPSQISYIQLCHISCIQLPLRSHAYNFQSDLMHKTPTQISCIQLPLRSHINNFWGWNVPWWSQFSEPPLKHANFSRPSPLWSSYNQIILMHIFDIKYLYSLWQGHSAPISVQIMAGTQCTYLHTVCGWGRVQLFWPSLALWLCVCVWGGEACIVVWYINRCWTSQCKQTTQTYFMVEVVYWMVLTLDQLHVKSVQVFVN